MSRGANNDVFQSLGGVRLLGRAYKLFQLTIMKEKGTWGRELSKIWDADEILSIKKEKVTMEEGVLQFYYFPFLPKKIKNPLFPYHM